MQGGSIKNWQQIPGTKSPQNLTNEFCYQWQLFLVTELISYKNIDILPHNIS